jgi:hypothetical protein
MHDIDVETGPRQMPSRYLRKRLELLFSLYPPPEGYAVFPESATHGNAQRRRGDFEGSRQPFGGPKNSRPRRTGLLHCGNKGVKIRFSRPFWKREFCCHLEDLVPQAAPIPPWVQSTSLQ